MSGWTVEKVLRTLRERGKPGCARIYAKHGVTEESFGVSYADLGSIVKTIKRDHALALALWDTGIHDARILATKIADPSAFTKKEFDAWLSTAGNYIVTDALAMLAVQAPGAFSWAAKWTTAESEWVSSTGWTTLVALAQAGRLDVAEARSFIDRVEREIKAAPNRTRHAMNQALISIGGNIEELRDEVLAMAARIGKVEVDHGETGCVTPDSAAYIHKMVARRSKKTAAGATTGKPAKTRA